MRRHARTRRRFLFTASAGAGLLVIGLAIAVVAPARAELGPLRLLSKNAVEQAEELYDLDRKSGSTLKLLLKAHEAAHDWDQAYETRAEIARTALPKWEYNV